MPSGFAVWAFTTTIDRREQDIITFTEVGDAVAQRDHFARRFMAEYQRIADCYESSYDRLNQSAPIHLRPSPIGRSTNSGSYRTAGRDATSSSIAPAIWNHSWTTEGARDSGASG